MPKFFSEQHLTCCLLRSPAPSRVALLANLHSQVPVLWLLPEGFEQIAPSSWDFQTYSLDRRKNTLHQWWCSTFPDLMLGTSFYASLHRIWLIWNYFYLMYALACLNWLRTAYNMCHSAHSAFWRRQDYGVSLLGLVCLNLKLLNIFPPHVVRWEILPNVLHCYIRTDRISA